MRTLFDIFVVIFAIFAVASGDPILTICGPLSAIGYFAVIRREKTHYHDDGIAYGEGGSYIYDWRKYLSHPSRREAMEQIHELVKRLPPKKDPDGHLLEVKEKEKGGAS